MHQKNKLENYVCNLYLTILELAMKCSILHLYDMNIFTDKLAVAIDIASY